MMMTWYDRLQGDLRLASRRAARQATFTTVVVMCLAVGIGGAAGVFSVIEPVLLDPLPFEDPDELYQIAAYDVSRTDPDQRYWMSWRPTESLMRDGAVLDGVAGFYQREFDLQDGAEAERVAGAETLPGSFGVLGVRPLLGRDLIAADVASGRRTAVITESLWVRRYARDPAVLGRTLTLGERTHEIVGVLPEGIRFPNRAEVYAAYHPDDYTEREQLGLGVILVVGRLPEARGTVELQSDLDAMLGRLLEAEPIFFGEWGFEAVPLTDYLIGDFRRPLWALFAAAGFVLVLAVANVANLLLARAHAETWEMALRTALGAPRRTLARQSLVENTLLATVGAALGTFVAIRIVHAIVQVAPPNNPAFDAVGASVPVLGLAIGLAAVVGVFMSTVPVVCCMNALGVLREGRSVGGGARERRLQKGFVITQITLSLVLLVGAGLMVRSFVNLRTLDLGFEPDGLLVARVSAPPSVASSIEERSEFTRAVLERLRAAPGVEAAGAVSWLPFEDGDVGFNYSVQEFPPEASGDRDLASGRIVAPGYFQAMGIELLRGRDFDESDRLEAPRVAVVSRRFEREYWPGGSALGKRIKRGAWGMDRPWIEIVGVVDDARSGDLSAAIQPALYYPLGQSGGSYLSVLAYTLRVRDGDPTALTSAVRAAVAELAPAATVFRVSTGADVVRVALGRSKFESALIGLFAVMGLVLAAAGIYGATSYQVGRRVREFGLRLAVGAHPRQVRAHVLRGSLSVAAVGIAAGLVGALALTAGLDELLFEVDPLDWSVYLGVSLLLATTVLAASYLPARRATRVDPTTTLREEA